MDTTDVRQAINRPDPDFLRVVAGLPEPPFQDRAHVLALMPTVHNLFLKKKAAIRNQDTAALRRVVRKETELLSSLEG